jgi:hypothetical protein
MTLRGRLALDDSGRIANLFLSVKNSRKPEGEYITVDIGPPNECSFSEVQQDCTQSRRVLMNAEGSLLWCSKNCWWFQLSYARRRVFHSALCIAVQEGLQWSGSRACLPLCLRYKRFTFQLPLGQKISCRDVCWQPNTRNFSVNILTFKHS